MEKHKTRFKSVDEYTAMFPRAVKDKIETIRKIVRDASPDVEEVISYNMPAYKLNGMLLYFAIHENHIGFYPLTSALTEFKSELADFKTSKGTIKISLDKPLPVNIIKKIVKFRVVEQLKKAK